MSLTPADWELKVEEELSDLEKKILSDGEKLRSVGRVEVLKLRKAKLVPELDAINAELAKLSPAPAPAKVPAPAPAPKPQAKPVAKAPAKKD